jgi:hypothetical protein
MGKKSTVAIPFFLIVGSISASGSTLTDTLPEFNSPEDVGATYRVGTFDFTLPFGSTVLSATLSGTYGNSNVPNSSGVDIFLGGNLVNSCSADASAACQNSESPIPWSANINVNQTPNLDLGSTFMNVTQTSPFDIRLGPTTLTIVISPSTAQRFYNNVAIPVSGAFNEIAGALREVGIDASVVGAVALASGDANEAAELFQQEGELLSQSRYLGQAPSASNLQPFADPPLSLPTVTTTGGLTATMIANFNQLDVNIGVEVSLIADLTLLGGEIQAVLSKNGDAATYIAKYKSDLASLRGLSGNDKTIYSNLALEFDAAGLDMDISQSEVQNYIESLSTNGFPSLEDAVFADLGVTPQQILNDILNQNFSSAPDSLVAAFSEAASVEGQISTVATTGVPEASTWAMMLMGLAGLGIAGYCSSRRSAWNVA